MTFINFIDSDIYFYIRVLRQIKRIFTVREIESKTKNFNKSKIQFLCDAKYDIVVGKFSHNEWNNNFSLNSNEKRKQTNSFLKK